MSSGLPSLLLGLASAKACVPPERAINPLAILVGKKPGAMLLQRMPRGPNSTAKLRVRCSAAALEALYPGVAFSPRDPIPMPATEAVTSTREGSSSEAFFSNRGANLVCQHVFFAPLICIGYPKNSLLNAIKHTVDIQIHDLGKGLCGMLIKRCSPGSTRVCKEYVHMVSMLHHLIDQPLNLLDFGNVRRDRDGFTLDTWKLVQSFTGFLAGLCFT
jgi:hypothetical protein